MPRIVTRFLIVVLFVSGVSFASFPNRAEAASTGWINASQLQSFSRNVLRRGFIPTRIRCRSGSTTSSINRRNVFVNVTYQRNTQRKQWRWAWGVAHKQRAPQLRRQGFRQVSFDSYRRPSGLVVPCSVWHR